MNHHFRILTRLAGLFEWDPRTQCWEVQWESSPKFFGISCPELLCSIDLITSCMHPKN